MEGKKVREEDLDSSPDAENSKDDEELPGDVGESWRDEEAKRKIEQPVADSRNTL